MATYDLICLDCGNAFELFVQGFMKDEDGQCPACGSFKVRQKFAPFLSNIGGSASSGGCDAPASSGFG